MKTQDKMVKKSILMTLKEFQKKINKINWYDKYWYYFVFALFSSLWSYTLYDAITNPAKYNRYGTRYIAIIASVLLICLCIRGIFLVPNRYKVLVVNSYLKTEDKQAVIVETIKRLNVLNYAEKDTVYSFLYKKNWRSSTYISHIGFDEENFYVSVQSKTGGYYGGGIIDFGGTEKFRKYLIGGLTKAISKAE